MGKIMRQILKEALTVCLFIDEMQDKYERDEIPNSKLSIVRRVVRNLLRRMKQSGYDKQKDRWGETFYKRIEDHLDSKPEEYRSTSVYLTYIQMQIHSFLRHYLPNKMAYGNYRRNTKYVSYYKPTLEVLIR